MLKVIGELNCSRCLSVKNMLTNNGISFEYAVLGALPKEEREAIILKAREKKALQLPILLMDGEIVSLTDITKWQGGNKM